MHNSLKPIHYVARKRILSGRNSTGKISIQILKLSILLVFAILVFVVASHTGFLGVVNNRSYSVQDGSNRQEKLPWSGEWHYPNMPKAFNVVGHTVTVLAEAKNRRDIVNWAEKEVPGMMLTSILTQDSSTEWLLVRYIGTSGLRSWTVHLFADFPINDRDKRPWKLLYVGIGAVDTSRYDSDIECTYIDTKNKTLVFAKRSGEIIKAIPITKELDFIRSHNIY